MKTILILICIFLVGAVAVYFYFKSTYPTGYFVQNQKVVFGDWIAGGHKIITTDLNPSNWKDLGNDYAHDEKIVVFNAHPLNGADVKTFQRIRVDASLVQDYYSRDKNYLYAGSGIVKGVDPDTADLWPGEYIKDKYGVYYKHQLLEGVDATSAELIKSKDVIAIKDKSSVYVLGKKIDGADIETFQIINDGPYQSGAAVFKDKNQYYDGIGEKTNSR